MQPDAEIFHIRINVTPDDIDAMDHVNVAYLRWVQDVAVAHWRHAATDAERQKWLWIVLCHEIDYQQHAPPYADQRRDPEPLLLSGKELLENRPHDRL